MGKPWLIFWAILDSMKLLILPFFIVSHRKGNSANEKLTLGRCLHVMYIILTTLMCWIIILDNTGDPKPHFLFFIDII
jgi:hypothetical protein